jgi:hypothetical protein
MENVYTEELIVLLEGMDHLMASHGDVKDDVHVQVKQEEIENAMSDYDMTRCPPPRGDLFIRTQLHPIGLLLWRYFRQIHPQCHAHAIMLHLPAKIARTPSPIARSRP